MRQIHELIITKQETSPLLSKKVIQFNKLLIRIQKAEKKLADTKNKLDTKLDEFSRTVLPVHKQRCELHLEILKEIFDHISSNKLSNTREEVLMNFCNYTATQIGMSPHGFSEEKFEEFKSILKKIHPDIDLSEEAMDEDDSLESDTDLDDRAEALEMTLDMIKTQYGMMGIEINLDGITIAMTDEEIADAIDARIMAVDPGYKSQAQKAKKKSKAQLRKEAAKKEFDEMKEKSFSSMYKNLVKLIHPDGEQDEKLREKKSEWMKRLTVAYKDKDLKTMMLIELEWLHGAKDELEKMSEEKMSYFIDMLKEQANEIDYQTAILYLDARYSKMAFFAQNTYQLEFFRPTACLNIIKKELVKDQNLLNELRKSPASARKIILDIIKNESQRFRHDSW